MLHHSTVLFTPTSYFKKKKRKKTIRPYLQTTRSKQTQNAQTTVTQTTLVIWTLLSDEQNTDSIKNHMSNIVPICHYFKCEMFHRHHMVLHLHY